MLALLPAWPLLLGAGVLITAFLLFCVCRFGEETGRHWSTRCVGVFYCPVCRAECDETEPCWCCREAR